MKRWLCLLLVFIFLLNGCSSVSQGETAVLGEKVEKENAVLDGGGNPSKKEDATTAEKPLDSKQEQEDSQETPIPNVLGGGGWTVANAVLYEKDAYYSAWHRDGDVYSFKLRLGGDGNPEYLGKGEIVGLYGSLLIANFDHQTVMKDLSEKSKDWQALPFAMPGGRATFGGTQGWDQNHTVTNPEKTRTIQYQNKVWLFRTDCVYVVDTAEKTVKKTPLEKSIQAAYIDGNELYYSIIETVNPIVDETVVYKAELPSKKPKELLRCSSKADWRYANGRIIVFEDGKNPIVFDTESEKTVATTDLLKMGEKIEYSNLYDGFVIAECGRGEKAEERYWVYDLSTRKETVLEGREKLPKAYYTFADGNYYYTGAEHTMTVLIGEKQYTLKSPDGKSKFGVNAANQYGAIVGTDAGLYTALWGKDKTYVLCPIESHEVPWE